MRHADNIDILRKITSMPQTTIVHLSTLSSACTKSLLCQLFSVQNVPDDLVKMVHAKAEGNPLFIEGKKLYQFSLKRNIRAGIVANAEWKTSICRGCWH